MKVEELLEFFKQPIYQVHGTLGQLIGSGGTRDEQELQKIVQKEIMRLEPNQRTALFRAYPSKGWNEVWAGLKNDMKLSFVVYDNGGELTMKHPAAGTMKVKIGMNTNLGDPKTPPELTGVQVTTKGKGDWFGKTASLDKTDINKASDAVNTQLKAKGIDPKTGAGLNK